MPTEFTYRGRVYSYTTEPAGPDLRVTIEGPDGTVCWVGQEPLPAAEQVEDWKRMMDDFLAELLAPRHPGAVDWSEVAESYRGFASEFLSPDLVDAFYDEQDRRAYHEELATRPRPSEY